MIILGTNSSFSQEEFTLQDSLKEHNEQAVYVDTTGIMRWAENDKEVTLFGVNYTVPFAHAYRAHDYLNISHEEAISQDVYHMNRLGLDAYRIHVWDCEISDSLGNLIFNDHLRLLDYTIREMKKRGIKIIITPIAYWRNGYPEPPEETPGFSTHYGKAACLTNPLAIQAQERYLEQFMNHVNPYTGIAYKDDPDIIAIEVNNEPHHNGEKKEVTSFINRMVKAIKNTGCKKPVFYNMSHSIHLAEAYFQSDAQGGTFQWYPAGLVHQHELQGNFLPNVSNYPVPFADNKKFQDLSRIVYEFDAADVGKSYIYPYMAKSMREAGFQAAALFSYDPMHMAYANTEYHTHFMNLAYTPQKALSLLIASRAFHQLQRGEDYGTYPSDTVFDFFRVSYEQDLAELSSIETFMYTNNTNSEPLQPKLLKHVAGYGSSPVVEYDGYGAYFIDRLSPGVWRLELMPDALRIKDPFGPPSLKKKKAVIIRKERPIKINLPNLGYNFHVQAINKGNQFDTTAQKQSFEVKPGTYLLTRKGTYSSWGAESQWKNIRLKEYVAPQTNCNKTYLLHKPKEEVLIGKSFTIEAKVISSEQPESVNLFVYGEQWQPEKMKMHRTKPYIYQVEIPAGMVNEGFLRYFITLSDNGQHVTYPSHTNGDPMEWDFIAERTYQTRVVSPEIPICLFEAERDGENIYGNTRFSLVPSKEAGETIVNLYETDISSTDNIYSIRSYFKDYLNYRKDSLEGFGKLVFSAYTRNRDSVEADFSLVLNNGATYGKSITLQPGKDEYTIYLTTLKQQKTLMLPNAYPNFMPHYMNPIEDKGFDLGRAEAFQLTIKPGILLKTNGKMFDIAIEKLSLVK